MAAFFQNFVKLLNQNAIHDSFLVKIEFTDRDLTQYFGIVLKLPEFFNRLNTKRKKY